MGICVRVAGDPSGIRPPVYHGDAGMDLVAAEEAFIFAGNRAIVSTGVKVQIPFGYAGLVLPRSSACKTGVTVTNAPGLIDSGYRGEIKVGLINLGEDHYVVKPGQRIAQLVIIATPKVVLTPVEELSPSDRGSGGFGSTGE